MILSMTAAFLAASLCPPNSAVTPAAATATSAQLPMVGGFRAANVEDPRVHSAAVFAAGELGGELSEIESAEQQVVAGMNFRLVISTTDGARYRVLVHLPLREEMRLVNQEQLKAAEGDEG